MHRLLARAPRLFAHATLGLVVLTLALTTAFAFGTLTTRPLDGVEGDVLFEALRMRSGLPLWVSPWVGAAEHGLPPSRYFVLYPPLWSFVLSLAPAGVAPIAARLVSTLAWATLVAGLALRAPRGARLHVAGAGAFVFGTWLFTFYAGSGRPDGVAVVVAGIALVRSVRNLRVDATAGALFAVAAWLKPNVVGALPGAFVATLLFAESARLTVRARRAVPGVVGVAVVSAMVVAALEHASSGVWLSHLLASTVQPPDASLFLRHLAARAPMFALPFGLVLVLAWRARRERPRAAFAGVALATSLSWCLLSFAKTGSAANYLLEPAVCALVVLGDLGPAPLASWSPRARTLLGAALLVQALWTCTASMSSAVSGLESASMKSGELRNVRETCGAAEGEVVLADEPGLELSMNGRLVQTPFQATHLSRHGRFPEAAWLDDVRHPRVACYVAQDDLLERDLGRVDEAHDRLPVAVRAVLRGRMQLVRARGGLWIYALRDRATREGLPR